MGFLSKSILILLVAVSTPLIYRHYANDDTIKFISQYYSSYKVIDQILRQSAGHLDRAGEYLPDSKRVKTVYDQTLDQLSKQFRAFIKPPIESTKNKDALATSLGDTRSKSVSSAPGPSPSHLMSSCPNEAESVRVWSKAELSNHDGNSGEPDVLLGFLGVVYNVTINGKHYGPGAEYNVFAGRDATRAFVTGNFTHDLTDDITDVDEDAYTHIDSWASFYTSTYQSVGRIDGAFYNSDGCAKPELLRVYDVFDKLAERKKSQNEQEKNLPECNSEWNGDTKKGKVWCSKKSGGIERDWVGVPRIYGDGDSKRCVCVNLDSPGASQIEQALGLYPGCDPSAEECPLEQP